eukprot:1121592-Pyramimonas_sp.AAC.1
MAHAQADPFCSRRCAARSQPPARNPLPTVIALGTVAPSPLRWLRGNAQRAICGRAPCAASFGTPCH